MSFFSIIELINIKISLNIWHFAYKYSNKTERQIVMNFQQLEYFLSLCKHMNYSETARRLYVSQPTVSKQIAALEGELNMKLFDRSNNVLSLTPEGKIMQEAFESALHTIDSAREEALHLTIKISQLIHFGMLEGADIASPILRSLSKLEKQMENTRFSYDFLNHETLNKMLDYNEIDMAVTLQEEVLHNPMIEHIPLRSFRHGLVIHKSLLCPGSIHHISDLCQNRTFYITSNGSRGYKQYVKKLCAELHLDKSCFHIVPDIETQILNVESGMGISVLSLTPKIENNSSLIFFPLESMRMEVVAAWHKNNSNEARKQLIKMIRKYKKSNGGVF